MFVPKEHNFFLLISTMIEKIKTDLDRLHLVSKLKKKVQF